MQTHLHNPSASRPSTTGYTGYGDTLPMSGHGMLSIASLSGKHGNDTFERGAVAVDSKFDFFRDLWGIPHEIAQVLESHPNLQATDLITLYNGRDVQIPSVQVTAMSLNQNSWLTDVAPIQPTNEMNFTGSFKEMNMIDFSRTAIGGIPNEQTYRQTSWSDKVEKVQLNARVELDLALDPINGRNAWEFELTGLAANAMLTINKTIAYSIIHIAYANMVGDNTKLNPYDVARALASEEETFGLAAMDQTKFLRTIRRVREQIPDFDTCIIPHNSVSYIAELEGESTSMQTQKIITDPLTGNLMWAFSQGKKSVKTVTYGDSEKIHFVEMPVFYVNMVLDSAREQPLRTAVTVAQCYPPDEDYNADDTNASISPDTLDIHIYEQKKNQGDERRIVMKNAYRRAFYYREDDGKVSDYVYEFCAHKNRSVRNDPSLIPWNWNSQNTRYCLKDNDAINVEPKYDYNTPNMDYIRDKEVLLSMRGWRDEFFGITWVPSENAYKVPAVMADFSLEALPNKYIHRAARYAAHKAAGMSDLHFDAMIHETMNLLDDIDNTPFNDKFLTDLINVNIDKMYDTSTGTPQFSPRISDKPEFPNASKLQEWHGNAQGSLDIPKRDGGYVDMVYPPGFGSGAGLRTLAKLAHDQLSEWNKAGTRAYKVVKFWDMCIMFLREVAGNSRILDPAYTPAWFDGESALDVLLSSVRPHMEPVFLAVPKIIDPTGPTNPNAINERDKEEEKEIRNTYIMLMDKTSKMIPNTLYNTAVALAIVDTYNGATDATTFDSWQTTHTKHDRLWSKLIGFIITSIYKQPSLVQSQLNIVSYLTAELVKILATASVLESTLRKFETELDDFMKVSSDITSTDKELHKKVTSLYATTIKKAFTGNDTKDVESLLARMRLFKIDISPLPSTSVVGGGGGGGLKGEQFKYSFTSKGGIASYLRAPLMVGKRIGEYLRSTTLPLIKPADPYLFFEAPIESYHYRKPEKSRGIRLNGNASVLPGVSFGDMPHAQSFRRGIKTLSSGGGGQRQTSSSKSTIFSDFPTQKSTRVSSKSLDYASLMSFGNKDHFGRDDEYVVRKERQGAFRPIEHSPMTQEEYNNLSDEKKKNLRKEEKETLKKQAFFGPSKARRKYMNEKVNSLMEKLCFHTFCYADNNADLHERLADFGQKFFNVMHFRLSIQHVMSSAIVMKAGKNTLKTAIGHSRVWVNTEQRGFCIINASFYLGVIRTNPNAIRMIPHVFPEAFVGGMGMDYMTDPSHFNYPTHAKESIIACFTPANETKYEFPIQLQNLPTYIRRDISNAPHNRKWSSSEFLTFVLKEDRVRREDASIRDSKKYFGNNSPVSLCIHRGPVRYNDGKGHQRLLPGTGPRGEPRKNTVGAHDTWNGQTVKFPDLQTGLLYKS